ncbi:MAG: hypothetical protein PHI42_00955 [Paludibacteraceae bacterium]|nr:hypothetical protein [Paludibacteraceae bacterium]
MEETTQQNLIELYKTMLSNEITNHTIVVTILLGITVLLLGATWWWNKQGAKKTIEQEIKKKFDSEKKHLLKEIKEEIDEKSKEQENRICKIEANTARSIGISAMQQKYHDYSVGWFAKYLNECLKLDDQKSVRRIVNIIIEELSLVEENGVFNLDLLKEVTEKLPDYLTPEKQQIKKLLKGKKDIHEE